MAPRSTIFLWASIFWTLLITLVCLCTYSDVPKVSISNIDKLVHISLHFIFVLLWYLFFESQKKERKINLKIKVFLGSLLFGILIEILQGVFAKTRSADLFDVFANAIGAFSALLMITLFEKLLIKETN